MSSEEMALREKFENLFRDWQKVIQDPTIQSSSRPKDYADNKPYQEIVNLGEGALPFLIEKMEEGNFLLNQAVIDIAGIKIEEIIGRDRPFPSEQEKSSALIEWWRSRQK